MYLTLNLYFLKRRGVEEVSDGTQGPTVRRLPANVDELANELLRRSPLSSGTVPRTMQSPKVSSVTVWPVLSGLPAASLRAGGRQRAGAQAWSSSLVPSCGVRSQGTFAVISQGLVNRSGLRVTLGGGAVITCNYV